MNDFDLASCRRKGLRCWHWGIMLAMLTFLGTPQLVNAQSGNIQGIAPVMAPTNGTAIDGNAYANHVFGLIDGTSGFPQNYGTAGDIFYWDQVYPGEGGGVFDILPILDPPYFNVSENSYPGVV